VTSVVVVVVVYLGASVCGLDTLGHLLCAISNCVHGVEPVPANYFCGAAGGLCCCWA
jgi:hypothetical protein